MNNGIFSGLGTGVVPGSISRYIQTPTILTSRTIAVPPGTQRIEALLCGGGGGGSDKGGGGFGGMAIMSIPITGAALIVIVGAGGAAGTDAIVYGGNGGTSFINSAGITYAKVGGGGGGGVNYTSGRYGEGSWGGGGGGGNAIPTNLTSQYAGNGGNAPFGTLLWHPYSGSSSVHAVGVSDSGYYLAQSAATQTVTNQYVPFFAPIGATAGRGAGNLYYPGGNYTYYISPTNGTSGGGGGGACPFLSSGIIFTAGIAAEGGGGASYQYNGSSLPSSAGSGNFGGGGGASTYTNYANGIPCNGGAGGSLATVSVWGYTGFVGGAGQVNIGAGGGGGGMLSAGAAGANNGGAGGLGGGGGGGHIAGSLGYVSGVGGNGFAVIRFYL